MGRALEGQLALELFPKHSPTWDDVQKGRAEVVYRYEPCDRCAGELYGFWDGEKCLHVKGRFGFPKRQDDGTCRKTYLEWR